MPAIKSYLHSLKYGAKAKITKAKPEPFFDPQTYATVFEKVELLVSVGLGRCYRVSETLIDRVKLGGNVFYRASRDVIGIAKLVLVIEIEYDLWPDRRTGFSESRTLVYLRPWKYKRRKGSGLVEMELSSGGFIGPVDSLVRQAHMVQSGVDVALLNHFIDPPMFLCYKDLYMRYRQ